MNKKTDRHITWTETKKIEFDIDELPLNIQNQIINILMGDIQLELCVDGSIRAYCYYPDGLEFSATKKIKISEIAREYIFKQLNNYLDDPIIVDDDINKIITEFEKSIQILKNKKITKDEINHIESHRKLHIDIAALKTTIHTGTIKIEQHDNIDIIFIDGHEHPAFFSARKSSTCLDISNLNIIDFSTAEFNAAFTEYARWVKALT